MALLHAHEACSAVQLYNKLITGDAAWANVIKDQWTARARHFAWPLIKVFTKALTRGKWIANLMLHQVKVGIVFLPIPVFGRILFSSRLEGLHMFGRKGLRKPA